MHYKPYLPISLLVLLTAFLFPACEKDDTTAHVSRITNYPVVALKGEEWATVLQGSAYTDPGVTATIGGQAVEVQITQPVNPNVPGVYVTTYTAINEDGFPVSVSRKVGVISAAAAALDLSGQYKRNAGAEGVSTITRLGPGYYQTDNVGGVAEPGPETTVRFFHYEVDKLDGPPQEVAGNIFSVVEGTVIPGVSYSWVVIGPNYGTAVRTFVKL